MYLQAILAESRESAFRRAAILRAALVLRIKLAADRRDHGPSGTSTPTARCQRWGRYRPKKYNVQEGGERGMR